MVFRAYGWVREPLEGVLAGVDLFLTNAILHEYNARDAYRR